MPTDKKTFVSVSFVTAGNFLNAVMGFIFLSAVAKSLSLELFGRYALLTSLLTTVGRLTDFGTNSLYVSDHDPDQKKLNSRFLTLKIFLTLAALVISVLLLPLLKFETGLIVTFVFGVLAYSLSYILYAFYQKLQNYSALVLINALPSVIKLIFAVLFFTSKINLNLQYSFSIFSLSVFAGLLVLAVSNENSSAIKMFSGVRISSCKDMIDDLRKAVSPGVSQFIYESWQAINNLLTKFFNSYTQVAVFSMANKISQIFAIISYSIFTVLLPKNVNRKKAMQSYNFQETAIIGVLVLVFSFVAIEVSNIFLGKLFGDKFSGSLVFMNLLIFASAITAIQNFVENYFYTEHKTHLLINIGIVKTVLLVVPTLIFAPFYGLITLAYANLGAALAGLLLTNYLIVKNEKSRVVLQSS